MRRSELHERYLDTPRSEPASPQRMIYWGCSTCHATDSAQANSVEALEIEHFLATGCLGRVCELPPPPPPIRAFAACQQCGRRLEAISHDEIALSREFCFTFKCICHLTQGKTARGVCSIEDILDRPDRTVTFDYVFSLGPPKLRGLRGDL